MVNAFDDPAYTSFPLDLQDESHLPQADVGSERHYKDTDMNSFSTYQSSSHWSGGLFAEMT